MAGSSLSAGAQSVGYTLAGSGIVVLVGIFIAGMLIISLIPIYSPDNSATGYGEIYTITGLTIKAIYTNISVSSATVNSATVNFTGGSVINLQGLSDLCTAIFRAKKVQDFYACVATSFVAYGPTGNTIPNSVLRRRSLDDVALYEIGNISILFRNTCSNRRALGRWYSTLITADNSSCVARRAAACRAFITTPNPGNLLNQWSPMASGFTQLIASNGTGCAPVAIDYLYNVAYFNYANLYSRFNVSISPVNAGDCQYSAIVPQSNLTAYLNNQLNLNVSYCNAVYG